MAAIAPVCKSYRQWHAKAWMHTWSCDAVNQHGASPAGARTRDSATACRAGHSRIAETARAAHGGVAAVFAGSSDATRNSSGMQTAHIGAAAKAVNFILNDYRWAGYNPLIHDAA
jgi:hypothetical protein